MSSFPTGSTLIPNLLLLSDPEPPQPHPATPIAGPGRKGRSHPEFNELLEADGAWEERWAGARSWGSKLHLAPGGAGRTEFIEGPEHQRARPACLCQQSPQALSSSLVSRGFLVHPPPHAYIALVFILIKGLGHAESPCQRSLSLQLASFVFYQYYQLILYHVIPTITI